MKNLVGVIREQCVEEEMGCRQYLIRATSEGAVRVRQKPKRPLPLRELIFLHSITDILAWLPANHGQGPLDLLGVESRRQNREERAQTLEPANGRYTFLNRNVWEDGMGIIQGDDDEDEDEQEVEWLKAKSDGEPQAPPPAWAIVLDNVNIDT